MRRLATLVLSLSLLTGCSGIELDESNPAGADPSGVWILDFAESDQVPDLRNHRARERRRVPDLADLRRRPAGADLPFVVHDFQVLSADKITIELNHDSMGVQYEPGVYRDVSWGKRERGLWSVYAGWDAGDLRILSETNDIDVDERFILRGDTLTVVVGIVADNDEFSYRRVFNRAR
ncbi:MAG: hypothetical protein AAF541_07895 [Pseudomonadota bacterium]